MKVDLLSWTPEALELLLFTKQTRLSMDPTGMHGVHQWSAERKQQELDYMRGTIQSSWEFVDYVFLIRDVSRAFTHQLVRTRNASYAQQSQRTVDMQDFEYVTPRLLHDCDGIDEESIKFHTYRGVMNDIRDGYACLIKQGVPPQDARGVLPTNICTNIIAKFTLRTLADMAKVRLCTRTQGEYQEVFRAMRCEVINVHPWAEPFIRVCCAATGVCCFPNYAECPIKGSVFNPDTGKRWNDEHLCYPDEFPATRDQIQLMWEEMPLYEARPKEVKCDEVSDQ